MVSGELVKLSKEVGRISIPSYIHSFLAGHKNITSFEEAYEDLIKWMPEDVPVPTLNEAILYYNMTKLQKVADDQLIAIKLSEEQITELSKNYDLNQDKIMRHKHNIEKKSMMYRDFARDLTKLANSGVDRESNINSVKSLNKITVQQLNVLINQSDEFLKKVQ